MKIKITRFRIFAGLAIAVMAVASIWTFVLAVAPATVTDNFDDSSKIASSAQVTVANGVVALSAASTWTCGSSLVDSRDGAIYATVLIGSQCWMAANLNVGVRVNGSATQTTTCAASDGSDIQKYCYSDTVGNCTTYGGLYQWNQTMCGSTTAGAQGICPTGWHVPTDAEQDTLDQYLKDNGQTCDANRSGWDCATAGTKLKSGGSSGFNGLLAGYRRTDGSFYGLSSLAYFWSSVQSGSSAWYRNLNSGYTTVRRYADDKANGFSVRCLKN